MSRIGDIEYRLKKYGERLEQLECYHAKVCVENWGNYSEVCAKCGKFFRKVSEQEFLEASSEQNKGTSKIEILEKRLAALKKEQNGKG